ncbi:hypothetical protein NCS55_01474300 [Fusarium keratoplasticum]|nr:hypothetical protein NCS55_01474300 [Fusarium keratoplasticum]
MSEKVEKAGDLSRKSSQEPRAGEVVCGEVQLARHLGSWEIICIAWNVINVFGGLSYIFVVGFSAGGLSTIFYGFLGSTACTLCTMSVLAECASLFPTAGGAYHFSTFLCPEKYRRYVGYPIGIISMLGFVGFTITLLARAPKADASFVFTTVNNETGYSSSAMAVAIGLYNCVVVWVSLDAVCHLAEEVPQPTRIIPKTLYIIVATQLTVGVVWILTV